MSADAAEELRAELKVWEKEFSESHGGKKPSSADIKACPEIALKYKEYSRLRAPLTSNPNVRTTKDVQATPSKRRKLNSDAPVPATPGARDQLFESPRKAQTTPSSRRVLYDENYHSPQSVKKFLDGERKTVGPTPQKNGVALGLFDLFSTAKRRKSTMPAGNNVHDTPSKRADQSSAQVSITSPQSVAKSKPLSSFTTPSKPGHKGSSGDFSTPFKTPDFLKRSYSQSSQPHALSAIDESNEALLDSPEAILPKRRMTGRGLSSILAGLRKMEDERLDEELELMREVEMEEEERARKAQMTTETGEQNKEASTENEVSQFPEKEEEFDPSMLEILEDEVSTDSEVDAAQKTALNRDGQPRKIYKKKGQKRTTRRVKMRPVANAPKAHRSAKEILEAVTSVPQQTATEPDDDDEYGGDPFTDTAAKPKSSATESGAGVKKAVRKISATAHANFRRLKIRSRGSKPKGGGRFFRRR